MVEDAAAGVRDLVDSATNVGRIDDAKAEMNHTTPLPDVRNPFLEDQHVATAWRLHLYETVLPINWNHTQDALIERKRSFRIAYRKRNVRQAVRANHRNAFQALVTQ